MSESMEGRGRPENGIIAVFLLLAFLGLVSVACASYVEAGRNVGSQSYFTTRHAGFLLIAALVAYGCARIPSSGWRVLSFGIYLLALFLSLAVLMPGLGASANGATRWLKLGPVKVQPSELLKLGVILAMSAYLTTRSGSTRRLFPGMAGALSLMGLPALIVLKQDDLGTAIVLMLIGIALLFAAGTPKRYMALTLAGITLLGCAAIIHAPYRQDRVKAWLDPWRHKADEGYQNVQAYYAFGQGGWHGVGIGQGMAKYYLPAPHTDFVFATVAEETGIFGTSVIVGLFGYLAWMGLRVSRRSKSAFGRLASVGAVTYLCGQACLNIAVVTGLFPCTGVPLPFISYGGTSLIVGGAALGLLYSFSKNTVLATKEDRDEGHGYRGRDRRTRLPRPGGSVGPAPARPRSPSPVRR
ncbi:MAG: putative lipid II flippase FtsW [Armatimonadetes bacterium]|nr:putative lipid II flippase FtsW [Armatimonadota bacterium]